MVTMEELLGRLEAVTETPNGWKARCPSHSDGTPSLVINRGETRLLVKCQAGCALADVLAAIEVTIQELPDVAGLDKVALSRATGAASVPVEARAALALQLDGYASDYVGSESEAYASARFGVTPELAARLRLGHATNLGGGARLVVPFDTAAGLPMGFQARALANAPRAKWLGPANPAIGAWVKCAVLRSGHDWPQLLVTEGPGDGLTAVAAGYDTVAVRGASLGGHAEVLETIVEAANGRPVIVVPDSDGAGDKFARAIVEGLTPLGVKVSRLPIPFDTRVKDLTDWRADAGDRFADKLAEAVTRAESVDITGILVESLTEVVEAERLRAFIGENSDVRYTPEAGFYLLDNGVWILDTLDRVRTYAQQSAQSRVRLAKTLLADGDAMAVDGALRAANKLLRWAEHASSSRGIDAVIKELKALPGVACSINEFDRHKDLLAARNGVIDLRTGELLPHDAGLLLSRRVEFDYDPDAKAPRWEQFLAEVFDTEPELPAFMQRLIGYGITGETSEQCFAVLYGRGANGKSVFVDTLTRVFRSVTSTTQFSTFERTNSGGIPNDIAALKGSRLVMASEGSQDRLMDEATLKRVTGGDEVTARFMRAEFFSFQPQFLLLLASNYRPAVRGQDEGFWRRVKLVPFARYFAPEERDHKLQEKLLAEAPGIVAWAVKGASIWYEGDSLHDPEVIVNQTKHYRQDSNALDGFLPGVFGFDPDGNTTLEELWRGYLNWCEDENLPSKERWTRRTFSRALDERGLSRRTTNKGVTFDGVVKL